MNAGTSRSCVILSLILSLISLLLTLIAFYLPNWKSVQLHSTSPLPIFTSDENQMDPLIRGEVEKYIDTLYRRGDVHSFGLLTHCITGNNCGQNFILAFDEINYEYCHNIKHHHDCIYSPSFSSEKCTCQRPFYLKLSSTLLILILILEGTLIFSNLLRLCRRQYYFYNDLQLRILSIVSTVFSSILLLIIIIEQNRNRLLEPLEFFQSMHRHYLRVQIYPLSNNLEFVLRQIERDLRVHFGAAYHCMICVFIFTGISFFLTSTVEIQVPQTKYDRYERKIAEHKRVLDPPRIERFSPPEESRFPRQTKV